MFASRIFFLSLILAISSASAAEPLYQRFRPVAALPWTTPGVTHELVIQRLYQEPNKLVRSTLLGEYLKTVPASEFSRVFDLCLQLEEEDSPDDLLTQLTHAWARTDAAAAWSKCQALFEIIAPRDPLSVDSWGTGIAVLNPQAVAASDFWPETDKFAEAFSEGVTESGLPQNEKDRYLALQKARSDAWSAANDAVDHNTPFRGQTGESVNRPTPLTPEQIAEQTKLQAERDKSARKEKAQQKFLMEILACPPAEIRARLAKAGPELWEEAVVARALVRWMDGQASRGPEIVDTILNFDHPQGADRGIAGRISFPIEFLLEWALLDGAGFQKWARLENDGKKEERAELAAKSMGVAQAIAYRDGTNSLFEWVDDNAENNENTKDSNAAYLYWAQIDPGNALPWIWSHGGVRTYARAADSAVYDPPTRSSNVFRAIFSVLDHYVVPIPDDPLSMIMEQWSDTDAAGCARHGTLWNLRTKLYPKKRMIRLWTGYVDPVDGSVDDRHFGSLRIWAMRKPDQMRQWIRTEPLDDDVRQALFWLVDHANGGFELRTDGSPPLPIKPPQ